MDNPSDEAIAEALRLTMCNFSKRGINDFKDADHFEYGHTREVLKLIDQRNLLVEALEGLLEDTQHEHHNCKDPECPVTFARQALTQIRSGQ